MLRNSARQAHSADNTLFSSTWVLKNHEQHIPGDWDFDSVAVDGFRVPGVTHPKVRAPGSNAQETILFRDLARNVVVFPQNEDALDVTRMVAHAVRNPETDWVFPNDYDVLLGIVGGAIPVTKENADLAVLERWGLDSSKEKEKRRRVAGMQPQRSNKGTGIQSGTAPVVSAPAAPAAPVASVPVAPAASEPPEPVVPVADPVLEEESHPSSPAVDQPLPIYHPGRWVGYGVGGKDGGLKRKWVPEETEEEEEEEEEVEEIGGVGGDVVTPEVGVEEGISSWGCGDVFLWMRDAEEPPAKRARHVLKFWEERIANFTPMEVDFFAQWACVGLELPWNE